MAKAVRVSMTITGQSSEEPLDKVEKEMANMKATLEETFAKEKVKVIYSVEEASEDAN
jgi:hypothetical protein